MLALLSFIAVILVVVSVHEYGHYLAARLFRVRVLRFSVGFGKPFLKRVDRRGTEWVLAPIPLGGYVQMLDRTRASAAGLPDAETIESQSHWRRIVIYFAGPAANFILSTIIFMGLLFGGEVGLRPIIGAVTPDSPAAVAGVAAGDVVQTVNGKEAPLWRYVEIAATDTLISGDQLALQTESGDTFVISNPAAPIAEWTDGAAAVFGLLPYQAYLKPELAVVAPRTAAANAGLQVGDGLVMINNRVIDHWRDAVEIIQRYPNQPVSLIVWRAGAAVTVTAVLDAKKSESNRLIGRLGVAPVVDQALLESALVTVARTPWVLLQDAIGQTTADLKRTLGFVWLMLTGEASTDHISGPVGIAAQSGQAATSGAKSWWRFVAIISTSLAVLNLLPLPLLDGGHIFLSMIQLLIRRDLPSRWLRFLEMLGLIFLLTLMSWVIINDIIRLIT